MTTMNVAERGERTSVLADRDGKLKDRVAATDGALIDAIYQLDVLGNYLLTLAEHGDLDLDQASWSVWLADHGLDEQTAKFAIALNRLLGSGGGHEVDGMDVNDLIRAFVAAFEASTNSDEPKVEEAPTQSEEDLSSAIVNEFPNCQV